MNKAFNQLSEKIFNYRNAIEYKDDEQWAEPIIETFSTQDDCFSIESQYVFITMMTEKANNKLIIRFTFKKTDNKYIIQFENVKVSDTTGNYLEEDDYMQCVCKTLEYMY